MRSIVGSGYGMGGFVQDVTDFERLKKKSNKNVAVPATTTIKKKAKSNTNHTK